MARNWLRPLRRSLTLAFAALLASAGAGRADEQADLKARIEAQQKQIEELKHMIQSGLIRQAADADPAPKMDEKAVQKIVETYLTDHPGAGMPPSVQTGWSAATGFAIRSAPDPKYVQWNDASRIPFELRIRGRIQADWYWYKPTDSRNHLTGADTFNNTSPDFDQLLIKRARFSLSGTAFNPDLRYFMEFDGNTRGLAALAGGGVPGTTGLSTIGSNINATNGTPNVLNTGAIQGGNTVGTVDHAVRLFSAYVAYDWHPCWSWAGCSCDCPDGTYKYQPTITFIAGKFKPYFSFEEYMGSGNQQMVEYGMAEWFFDADDDNLLMQAGVQAKLLDDRLFLHATVTNGNETQIANVQMDDLPGFNFGFWYDFGGNFDYDRKRWVLFGDCLSDIDYSCKPVVRVGAMANLVPQDRRSEFTNAEMSRQRVIAAAPGGSTFIGLLNGGGVANNAAGLGQFAVDAIDEYTFEAFVAAKYKGFSILSDWWVRDYDNFRGRRFPTGAYPGNGQNQPILYSVNSAGSNALTNVALFPANHGVVDYGMMLQAGYFIVPKKLEIAGRWSWIRGQSGSIRGDETFTTLTAAQRAALGIPATAPAVRVYGHAFDHYNEANEFAVGFNYYFKRQLCKWQTDFSWYNGGNPAAGGQSPAGFIPGVDGYMVRSQIQFGF
jgi:hypothetical protein